MRYRRLSYRYAVMVAGGSARPLGEAWHRQAAGVSLAPPSWRPATDVVETASDLFVTVELAGVDHEELDVLLFEDALIVEGERRLPPAHAGGVYHAAEIRQGKLRLELPLPGPIDPDQIEARYDRGLLQLRLVKRTGPGSISIPISRVVDSKTTTPTPTSATTTATLPTPARPARQRPRSERDEHGA